VKPITPEISVVLPCFNEQKTIHKAIESILDQSLRDFELIIVDDGSSDETMVVVEKYRRLDSRIIVLSNEINMGLPSSLNSAISLSNSTFIARMDADDISHPSRFEKQYEFMLANPDVSVVGTGVRLIDARDNTYISDCMMPELHEDIFKLRYLNRFNFHPTVMMRRLSVCEVGKYDLSLARSRAEDLDLWLKLSREYRFHNLQEVLLDYSVNLSTLKPRYWLGGCNLRLKHMNINNELATQAWRLVPYSLSYWKRMIFSILN